MVAFWFWAGSTAMVDETVPCFSARGSAAIAHKSAAALPRPRGRPCAWRARAEERRAISRAKHPGRGVAFVGSASVMMLPLPHDHRDARGRDAGFGRRA